MKNSISILTVSIALAIVPSISCSAVSNNKPKTKPGTVLWEYTTERALGVGSPALGYDGNIYFPCENEDELVVSVNRITGKKIRNFTPMMNGMGSLSSITPSITTDGSIIIPWYHGNLLKFSDNKGSLQWRHENGGYNWTSASLGVNGFAYYCGSGTKSIEAVNIKTGKRQWHYLAKNQVKCTPVIGPNGNIFVGATDAIFYAIDGMTGLLKWKYTHEEINSFGDHGQAAAIDEHGWIYVRCSTKSGARLLAFQSVSGELKWSVDIKDGINSPSIGVNGIIYVGGQSGHIYAITKDTGKVVWRSDVKASGNILGAPAIGDDGTIYFGSEDRYIYAINTIKGELKWKVRTGDHVRSSPLLDSEGNLYVGSHDGRLYAIATSSTGPAKSPWPMFGQNAQRTSRAPAAK
jgi:outer membrane protein assembly factor BamB